MKLRYIAQSEGLVFLSTDTGWQWGTKEVRKHFDRCICELTGHFLSTDFEIEAATTTVIPVTVVGGQTNRASFVVTLVGVREVKKNTDVKKDET